MDIQALGMLSNITAIVQKQNVNTISGDINVEKDFYGTLREQQINCVKEDIYNKFHIDVGAANGYFECYIPSDVLYRMNTDTVLRQKVYDMLADYSSDKFKLTMQTLNPPVKKCTLVFDDNGEVVATLEPDVGGEKAASERSKNTEKVRIAMLDSGKFYGAGNVVISKKSLLRMQTDSRFRQKVYESIEGLGCTSKMTGGIVKSTGVFIHEDGTGGYWTEFDWGDEEDNGKGKKLLISKKPLNEFFQERSNIGYQLTENDIENIMPLMITGYYKKQE